jgi:hypothetical protein
VNPNGTQNNTGSGALIGGALGAISGAIIGHNHGNTGAGALIGAAAGVIAGGLVGNMIDQQQQQRLQQQSPQTWNKIQNNDVVYQQQQSAPLQPQPFANSNPTYAQPILDFTTDNPGNWTVTGGGAVNAAAIGHSDDWPRFGWRGNVISITSDGRSTGTFASGGNMANFDGFWIATYTFSLPKDANNIRLNFSNLFADDRVVLELNGTPIAAAGLYGPGQGGMVLSAGSSAVPYSFSNFGASGAITTGFNAGGQNTLMAIINNTGTGISGNLTPIDSGDRSDFAVKGTISYNSMSGGGSSSPVTPSTPVASNIPPATDNGSAQTPTPLTVDDIKALAAAGVRPDAINKEIDISQSKFSQSDIAAAQQANVNSEVIAHMQSHPS